MMRLLRFALLFSTATAWMVPSPRVSFSSTRLSMSKEVQVISLESLKDHEAEGSMMKTSIVKWLDTEWMPQEVHVRMAESAKKSYIASREKGDSEEIMSIMMAVAEDLNRDWFELYDADAFVNAWDIANYVSDYLTHRAGSETCECSNKIY